MDETVRRILATVCRVATATRTAAEREEDRIYTHFEGWLPDDDDLPTTKWTNAWCYTAQGPSRGLLRNSRPAATLAFPLPCAGAARNPPFDPTHPDVIRRIQARSKEFSY